jgi:PEP-CTERM motif-containing protein
MMHPIALVARLAAYRLRQEDNPANPRQPTSLGAADAAHVNASVVPLTFRSQTQERIMNRLRPVAAVLAMLATGITMPTSARAQSYQFYFNGPGLGGTLMLTYGAATDAKYPGAYEVTGVSGTFSDMNNGLGISNAPVGSLVAVNHATPDATNLLAPNDFSRFAVASGLPAQSNGFATYDNLFWPGGSPQTATDYPPHGGFLDIYGLLLNIGNDRVLNIWSNGAGPNGIADYGASVSTADQALDRLDGGVTATTTPEPASLWLIASGVAGMVGFRRRIRRG